MLVGISETVTVGYGQMKEDAFLSAGRVLSVVWVTDQPHQLWWKGSWCKPEKCEYGFWTWRVSSPDLFLLAFELSWSPGQGPPCLAHVLSDPASFPALPGLSCREPAGLCCQSLWTISYILQANFEVFPGLQPSLHLLLHGQDCTWCPHGGNSNCYFWCFQVLQHLICYNSLHSTTCSTGPSFLDHDAFFPLASLLVT